MHRFCAAAARRSFEPGHRGLHPDRPQAGRATRGRRAGGRDHDRAAVGELIRMKEHVDVIIPRGGKSLMNASALKRRYPSSSICTACVTFISMTGPTWTRREGGIQRQDPALRHVQYHGDTAGRAQRGQPDPAVLGKMYHEKGVELRGCEATRKFCPVSRAPAKKTGTRSISRRSCRSAWSRM